MASKKILIVDDEPQLVEMVQMRLEAHGYEVISAGDGVAAFAKARNERPALIILDIMLPKLNGYEVCTMLKQDVRYRQIPIVMFTAKTQEKDEVLALDCGANAYLRKPFRAEEMLATIQTLLGDAAHHQEVQ